MMKFIKDLFFYLKYREAINHNYGYALNEGYCSDESYNWLQRLAYYNDCLNYEPDYEESK